MVKIDGGSVSMVGGSVTDSPQGGFTQTGGSLTLTDTVVERIVGVAVTSGSS
jgi:hypothetical protein